MNENIDLTKILEGCPKGTKFYSSIWGTVTFIGIVDNINYPIRIKSYNKTNGEGQTQSVTKDGRYYCDYDGECTLFPSKDQRDWEGFEPGYQCPRFESVTELLLHAMYTVLDRVEGPLVFYVGASYIIPNKKDILLVVDENDNVKLRSDIKNILENE